MKRLSVNDFKEIQLWMYRNARDMELSLWRYYFEKGRREDILLSLSRYQNDDGGFGNALEADSWNPDSSPYTTLMALRILNEIDFNDTHHTVFLGIIRFFESGVYSSENGWDFTIPSNEGYPHAPWWTYNITRNETEGIGLNAEITSYLLKYAGEKSELHQKALKIIERLVKKLDSSEKFGDMGIGGYCILLDTIVKMKDSWNFSTDSIKSRLKELVYNSFERDSSKWHEYSVKPSEYIRSPESIFYQDNKDIISMELDYLIETRPKKGVWGIPWSWFENNEKYPKEFGISENWWKAGKAIQKIIFLKNFNRLDEKLVSVIKE